MCYTTVGFERNLGRRQRVLRFERGLMKQMFRPPRCMEAYMILILLSLAPAQGFSFIPTLKEV